MVRCAMPTEGAEIVAVQHPQVLLGDVRLAFLGRGPLNGIVMTQVLDLSSARYAPRPHTSLDALRSGTLGSPVKGDAASTSPGGVSGRRDHGPTRAGGRRTRQLSTSRPPMERLP